MKTKKLWALFLALVMALSMAVPAFAEGEGDTQTGNDDTQTGGGTTTTTPSNTASSNTQSLTMGGSTKIGVIDIDVATAGDIVLNPYQMLATIAGEDDDEDATPKQSYHQVFSPAVSCANYSTYALAVDAKLTATTGSSLVAPSAPTASTTAKNVYMWAEFAVTDKNEEPAWASSFNTKAANMVLLGASAQEKKGVATLPAAPVARVAADDDNEAVEGTPNYLWFKFNGSMTKSPTTAWTGDDQVAVAVALTLRPVVAEAYTVTVTNKTTTEKKGTYSLDFDLAPEGTEVTLTVIPEAGTASVSATSPKNHPITKNEANTEFKFKMPASNVALTITWA